MNKSWNGLNMLVWAKVFLENGQTTNLTFLGLLSMPA